MHQRLQRLLVALLVFVMFTSHITTTMVRAENNPEEPNKIEVDLTEEKKKELGIIQTTSIFEYADVLKNLNVSIQKKKSNCFISLYQRKRAAALAFEMKAFLNPHWKGLSQLSMEKIFIRRRKRKGQGLGIRSYQTMLLLTVISGSECM